MDEQPLTSVANIAARMPEDNHLVLILQFFILMIVLFGRHYSSDLKGKMVGFSKIGRGLTLICALLVLSGCAMYSVAGRFENGGEPFLGQVSVLPGDRGTLDVSTADGKVKCSGSTQVTKRPSLLSVIGAQGRAEATCTDGRTFNLDFVQTSESGGQGQGIDSQGNIVQVYFDTSSSAVRARLDQALIDALVQ